MTPAVWRKPPTACAPPCPRNAARSRESLPGQRSGDPRAAGRPSVQRLVEAHQPPSPDHCARTGHRSGSDRPVADLQRVAHAHSAVQVYPGRVRPWKASQNPPTARQPVLAEAGFALRAACARLDRATRSVARAPSAQIPQSGNWYVFSCQWKFSASEQLAHSYAERRPGRTGAILSAHTPGNAGDVRNASEHVK